MLHKVTFYLMIRENRGLTYLRYSFVLNIVHCIFCKKYKTSVCRIHARINLDSELAYVIVIWTFVQKCLRRRYQLKTQLKKSRKMWLAWKVVQFVIWDELKEKMNWKHLEVTGNSTKTYFSITFAYCSGKNVITYIFSVYILEIVILNCRTNF